MLWLAWSRELELGLELGFAICLDCTHSLGTAETVSVCDGFPDIDTGKPSVLSDTQVLLSSLGYSSYSY